MFMKRTCCFATFCRRIIHPALGVPFYRNRSNYYIMKRIIPALIFLILSSFSAYAQNGNKSVSLDDWLKEYKFGSRTVSGIRSMKDGIHYTSLAQRGKAIIKSSYRSGEVTDTIFRISDFPDFPLINDYEFSSDEKKILISTDVEPIYRRSYTAEYFLFEIGNKKISSLSENGRQQLATFSPDGNRIAFARDNNLFIKSLQTGEELQITEDGKRNHINNGVPDWVYEEEFEFNQAFHWSADGKRLAFIKFNESDVREFGMTMFAGDAPILEENFLYPEHRVWKYPKAGEANSIVSVHIYHIESKKNIMVDTGTEKDIYLPRIRWTKNPNGLVVFRLNRLQNKLELLLTDAETGKVSVLYAEENKFYIDEKYFDNLQFLDDNKHFVMMSEKDGYARLYLMDMNGKEISLITPGEYDVTSFLGYDSKNMLVYFQSAEVSPMNRDIYVCKPDGKGKKRLSLENGTNDAIFSQTFEYYLNYYSSVSTPTQVTLHQSNGKLIRELESNEKLKNTLSDYKFRYKEFFKFRTSEGIELNGSMIKPAGFDPAKKYPVLMTQYSGPNSQEVLNSWRFGWDQVMAALGYIVVTVDGRGTGARGEAFRKMTYLQLGKYETIDQVEAAKYLSTLDYIDAKRIGIWGWSYGGYISTLCMQKGDGIFKAGIAVAPVINWRYYDNIYTERFMRTPQENPEGYDQNSPLTFAPMLTGNYLIVHGSADDNVHVQNTMEFIEKLVQANKQFEMMIYTNRNHGIYGGNTRYHLYTLKTNFLLENL
jgi:dipeptidyl-peptidase 4